jgi:hypothetical protein
MDLEVCGIAVTRPRIARIVAPHITSHSAEIAWNPVQSFGPGTLLEIVIPRAHRLRSFVEAGTQLQDHQLEENHLRGLEQRTHRQDRKAGAARRHRRAWPTRRQAAPSSAVRAPASCAISTSASTVARLPGPAETNSSRRDRRAASSCRPRRRRRAPCRTAASRSHVSAGPRGRSRTRRSAWLRRSPRSADRRRRKAAWRRQLLRPFATTRCHA